MGQFAHNGHEFNHIGFIRVFWGSDFFLAETGQNQHSGEKLQHAVHGQEIAHKALQGVTLIGLLLRKTNNIE